MSDKYEFKAESRKLLDLMINSIYTNREIFLRELISNASDAIDKLRFLAVSDASKNIDTDSFAISLTLDKEARTLTVSDNGIGMSETELADNLGVIAASGTKTYREEALNDDTLIGQFGVGFYSAFMVADHITVISRKFDSDNAFRWESDGVDGYTIEPADKEHNGTDVILHIRPETDPESNTDDYNCFMREYPLYKLVRKYSDYIRYPIRMLMPHPYVTNEAEIAAARMEAETAAATGNVGPEIPEPVYQEVFEYETLNSMIPLWQRSRSEVTDEEYNSFYKEHFGDRQDPMSIITASVEGNISYKALLYIPAHTPRDYGTDEYHQGLELYCSGVLIMSDCRELLPEEFNFVRGVVDSRDLDLNISREMLQQTKQLAAISTNIGKKIKAQLHRMMTDEREKYLEFNKYFGHHIKVCAMDEYAAKKDSLADLLMFYSCRLQHLITLDEYVDAMLPEQKYIYYSSGSSISAIDRLPQTEVVREHGMDILYFLDKADDFVADMFHDYRQKPFRSVIDGDPELDAGAAKIDESGYRDTFEFIKEVLGSEVDDVRATGKLRSHPVCLSSGEGVTFEMEQYFKSIHKDAPIKAKRILELNVHHPAFLALDNARFSDPDRARKYCRILLNQAKMISGLPIEDPSEYTDLIVSLWR